MFFRCARVHHQPCVIFTLSSVLNKKNACPANHVFNQSIDLQSNSMEWFLYDIGLRRERVKQSQVLLNNIIDHSIDAQNFKISNIRRCSKCTK